MIKKQNLYRLVYRLGSFDIMTSFLGSFWEMIRETDLKDLFAKVYAEHSVTMSGETIFRDFYAHISSNSSITIDVARYNDWLKQPYKVKMEEIIHSKVMSDVSDPISHSKNI